MSLDYDYSKVKNPERWGMGKTESECTKEEMYEWSRMSYFAFHLMAIDMQGVTESNLEEVLFRSTLWQKVQGAIFRNVETGEDAPYTIDDIKGYMGYSTNVRTESRAEFMKKVVRSIEFQVKSSMEREEVPTGLLI